MDQVEIERSEDLLFESELPAPCEGQSIKLWYDDFSGRVYPAMPPILGQRMHQSYSLHYVTSGAGYFSVGDAPLCRLTAGQVFFVRARELVRYYPDPEAPWQYCGMSLCGVSSVAGRPSCYDLVLQIDEEGFCGFLSLLHLEYPDFIPLGIYTKLNS